MCACEPDFTCTACAGSRFDDRYPDDEPEPPQSDVLREDE